MSDKLDLSESDPRFNNLKLPAINDMPAVLVIKRKSIRVFPDGQRVALYYADAIDRYISVPFSDIGVTEEVEEEIMTDSPKVSFAERVQQLRESNREYKRYKKIELGPEIDDKKFKKAYINIERAAKAYKEGDFKKGDKHGKAAGKLAEAKIHDKIRNHPAVDSYEPNHGEHFVNLKKGYHWSGQRSFGTETASEAHKLLKGVKKEQPGDVLDELSRGTLATYAAFSGKDSTKAYVAGDAKRWRKRTNGTKLALSKYKGETKKDRENKPKHPMGDMEPKFHKNKNADDQNAIRFKAKKFEWNEEVEQLDENPLAVAAGAAVKKFGKWAAGKVLGKAVGGGNSTNNAANQNDYDYNEHDSDKAAPAVASNAKTTDPLTNKNAEPAKVGKKDRDDDQDQKIADLQKRAKSGGNSVNETLTYDFDDGSIQITGAVLNDIAAIYEKANATNKKRILESVTTSAESLRKFADFAVKTKDKIR